MKYGLLMHPLLESTWMKVNRANIHLEHLNAQIDTFSERQFQSIGVYLDRQTGEEIYRLDRPTEEPPAYFSPIIGDALFNYRSALDHLMWALVYKSGNTPDNFIAFPIFWDEADFLRSRRAKHTMESVTPEVQAAVKREQPYSGYTIGGLLVWRLHQLHIVDKHRHFNLVYSFYMGAWGNPADLQVWRAIANRVMTNLGRVEQGTILARIPREYVHVDFYPTFETAFSEASDAPGEPVRQVLGGIDDLVHNIVDEYQRLFFST